MVILTEAVSDPYRLLRFLFQSLGIENVDTILFLLHNKQQSLVSVFCYTLAPLDLQVKPQP